MYLLATTFAGELNTHWTNLFCLSGTRYNFTVPIVQEGSTINAGSLISKTYLNLPDSALFVILLYYWVKVQEEMSVFSYQYLYFFE